MTDAQTERFIVYEPGEQTAGLGVAYTPSPGPHNTQFTIEQLWSDGTADPVYVGGAQRVAGLIEQLGAALDVHYMTQELEDKND